MGFGKRKSSGSGDSVDYTKLNEYIVETCALQEKEPLVGIVSGIVDLGDQEQEDGARELKPDESKDEILEKFPNNYFKTEGGKEYVCWPQPPCMQVGITVDFPQIMLDKGPFFGADSSPRPLRLVLNGEFMQAGGKKVLSRPVPIKYTKEIGKWSLSPKNTLYKMAVASKLIKSEEVFDQDQIPDLLGKAFQFEVQVYMKPGKEKGTEYYTEYCKFVSGLGRGQTVPEIDESLLHIVDFDNEQGVSQEVLSEIRASIRNTMMLSTDYEKSAIRPLLEEAHPYMKDQFKKSKEEGGVMEEPASDIPEEEDAGLELEIIPEEEEEGIELEDNSSEDNLDDDVPF